VLFIYNNHLHIPVLISGEVDKVSQQCLEMKIKIIELFSDVDEKYKKYKNFIIYLVDSINKSQVIQPTHD
jgi:hypothetical protein